MTAKVGTNIDARTRHAEEHRHHHLAVVAQEVLRRRVHAATTNVSAISVEAGGE